MRTKANHSAATESQSKGPGGGAGPPVGRRGGLVDDYYNLVDRLRKLRNKLAHTSKPIDFTSPVLQDELAGFVGTVKSDQIRAQVSILIESVLAALMGLEIRALGGSRGDLDRLADLVGSSGKVS